MNSPIVTRTHTGHTCPCPADTLVAVDLGDGELHTGPAASWAWGPGAGPEGQGRIHSWAPIVPPAPMRTVPAVVGDAYARKLLRAQFPELSGTQIPAEFIELKRQLLARKRAVKRLTACIARLTQPTAP